MKQKPLTAGIETSLQTAIKLVADLIPHVLTPGQLKGSESTTAIRLREVQADTKRLFTELNVVETKVEEVVEAVKCVNLVLVSISKQLIANTDKGQQVNLRRRISPASKSRIAQSRTTRRTKIPAQTIVSAASLKEFRILMGLSRAELAQALGISAQTACNWETGKTRILPQQSEGAAKLTQYMKKTDYLCKYTA